MGIDYKVMYRHYLTIFSENQTLGGKSNERVNNKGFIPNIISNPLPNKINIENLGILNKSNVESNLSQKATLPNLPYSPFTSPNISPQHRLHPDGSVHSFSYNNNLSNIQQERRSTSITETTGAITELKQYHIREQLGQGSYGLVQLAYNQENETFYAMKSLSKKKLMKSSGLFNRPLPTRLSSSSASSLKIQSPNQSIDPLQQIYKEIAIHKKLKHPNIVNLIEVLDDPSQVFLYMVFEYVENGPVMIIGKNEPFSEVRAKKYFTDTLLGLEYLHYQKIIHRDIKPANLLLSRNDQVKIADFGVSNEFTGDDVYLTSTAGSPAFMAPESVRDGGNKFAGKALDIWALGITLYAFLYGKIPFENCNRYLLYQMIINNPVVYPQKADISNEVLNLLPKMLDKNPLSRIKLQEIKTDDWITNFGKNVIANEAENCGIIRIDVTDDEVANSIRFIPKIETVIKIKMLLKNKSFLNPTRYGSFSKLHMESEEEKDITSAAPIQRCSINYSIVKKQTDESL